MILYTKCHTDVPNNVIVLYENDIELNIRTSTCMSY